MGLTGNKDLDLLLIAGAVFGWVLLFRVIYAAREGIAWTLGAAARGAIGFMLAAAFLPRMGLMPQDATVAALVIAGVAVAMMKPRGRYIPAKVKRAVIARDLKGEKYNPKKHHLDHVWPHSKGGSNTGDNLRVISRKANLKKGAKKPSIGDLF
jgi:hypothetical protein